MSHIVSIKTKVTDPAALAAACRRLGIEQPVQGTAKLFSGQATGLLVNLPGWQFPVVSDVASGCGNVGHFLARKRLIVFKTSWIVHTLNVTLHLLDTCFASFSLSS